MLHLISSVSKIKLAVQIIKDTTKHQGNDVDITNDINENEVVDITEENVNN